MIIQSCLDENYSSGYSTNLCLKGETSNQFYGESSSTIQEKAESQPKFLDHYRKLQLDNISQIQLNLIVNEVAGTIIQLIDKQIHQAFCKQLNTVVTQILSIREQVTILSREQTNFREIFSNEIRQQIRNLQSFVNKFKGRSSSFVTFPSILKQQSLVYSPRERTSQQSCRYFSSKISQQNQKLKFEQLQIKIDELRATMQNRQKQLKNKLQEVKQKQSCINQSMRTQIEEINMNFYLEHDIKRGVEEHTYEIREDVLFCKKQIQKIKDKLSLLEMQTFFD